MNDLPKVSGILPVGYGDLYFGVAAAAFLASTYEGELELIILDNSETPIDHLIPDDSRVKYHRCQKMPVGALRNLGTSYATGDVCMSIDEDDWSHADRISIQVSRLLNSRKAVTGFHSIYYFETSNGQTYQYHYEPNRPHPPYACGSSQCYTKVWWDKHPFPATGVEDYAFQLEARHNDQLDSCDGDKLLVARSHLGSACYPTQLGIHKQFPAVPQAELPIEFFRAIEPPAKALQVAAKPKSKSQK